MLSRLAVFIDGANLYYTAKTLGFEIDFTRLLKEFGGRGFLLRAYYYAMVFDALEFSLQRPLLNWLVYNGFRVKEKQAVDADDGDGRRRYKRNIGIELAVDAMEIAPYVDKVFLFSGDGNFRRLVEMLQSRGIHVTVVSTLRSHSSTVADELRRQADEFIEIDTLRTKIGRARAERQPRDVAAREAPREGV